MDRVGHRRNNQTRTTGAVVTADRLVILIAVAWFVLTVLYLAAVGAIPAGAAWLDWRWQ